MKKIRPRGLQAHQSTQEPFRFREPARVKRLEMLSQKGSSSFLKKRTKKLLYIKVSTRVALLNRPPAA
jgi:hypothetical protein